MDFKLSREELEVIIEVFPLIMRKNWCEVNTSFRQWLIEKYPFMRMGAIMKLSDLYLIANRRERIINQEWIEIIVPDNMETHHPWTIVDWIIQNTKGLWASGISSTIFYFENSNDAMLFKLKWR
jgi:hypothetical protein